MKSISFKNFRRFSDFPEFKFGDITILVGGNNAGKSTLVKALILLIDNMREFMVNAKHGRSFMPLFSFDVDHIHQLNLGTYGRAHNNTTDKPIEMQIQLESFSISFTIAPMPKDEKQSSPLGMIEYIKIEDLNRKVTFSFNPDWMSVSFCSEGQVSNEVLDAYDKRINELYPTIPGALISEEQGSKIRELEVSKAKFICENFADVESAINKVSAPARDYLEAIEGQDSSVPTNQLSRLIFEWVAYQQLRISLMRFVPVESVNIKIEIPKRSFEDAFFNNHVDVIEEIGEELSGMDDTFSRIEHEANHKILENKIELLREIAFDLDKAINKLTQSDGIHYIQAHYIGQRVLYTIDNRNDYMAQVLHRFSREGIKKESPANRFLKQWLSKFGIGEDYRIESIGGEGYTVEIQGKDGNWTHLADLGMGPNQLVTLLLELATLINNKVPGQTPLVIVEEPEQNLHPRLQSMLADLFAELSHTRGFKFLIETHSEYLIRRTQVLVANNEDTHNPFVVYYFPQSGIPYDMGYRPDGRFSEEFGPGFFDEASNLTISLF